MSSESILFIGFALLALVVVVLVGATINQGRRAQWQRIGEHLGLRYSRGQLGTAGELDGAYRGLQVRVWCVDRGTSDSTDYHTCIETLHPHALGLGLTLVPEGFLRSVGKLLGGQDIQVGEHRFDSAFIVRGRDEDAVRRFLIAEVRDALLRYKDACGEKSTLEITDAHVYAEVRGILEGTQEIEALLKAQHDLIQQLQIGRGSSDVSVNFWEARDTRRPGAR